MQHKKTETRDGCTRPGLKSNKTKLKICNPQAQPRQYPEGWSRWIEPEPPCYADDFLEDWADAIVQARGYNHYEVNREASAWQRALRAFTWWRAK